MAPYQLQFEILRQAKARGCECYDLWGVSAGDEPNGSWHGVSVFKRKFGGAEVRLVPTLDRVYDPAAYAAYGSMAASWSGRTASEARAQSDAETICAQSHAHE